MYAFGATTPEAMRAALAEQPTDDEIIAAMRAMMRESLAMRWAVSQGMWTFGAPRPAAFAHQMQDYTLEGLAGCIACPTLWLDETLTSYQ